MSALREKKYIASIEGTNVSTDVPIYATSLEQAEVLASEYEDAGFIVTRIRPEVTPNVNA